MPHNSPGRRSRNYNAGNTPRGRASRGGAGHARRRDTFGAGYRGYGDFNELTSSVQSNMEVVIGVIYMLIILLIVGWLIFASNWYSAWCSEFVKKAEELNVALPSGWNKNEYKGCNQAPDASINNEGNNTKIYFGIYTFTHLDSQGNYQWFSFPLGQKGAYFWSFAGLLWVLVGVSLFGIIMAAIYWSMKTMSSGMMYTSKAMRGLFGPGNGVFAAIGFAISMVMHIDYRYEVKGVGKNHVLVLDSLAYGDNFTIFILVIVLFAVAIALSITLFSPDEKRLRQGKEARKSFKAAVHRASHANRATRLQPRASRASPNQLSSSPRRSRASRMNSRMAHPGGRITTRASRAHR